MQQSYKSLEMHKKFLITNLTQDMTQVQGAILDQKAK
jgi:hypothetical protein